MANFDAKIQINSEHGVYNSYLFRNFAPNFEN